MRKIMLNVITIYSEPYISRDTASCLSPDLYCDPV